MKAVWPYLPLWIAVLGCQSTTLDEGTSPELAPLSEEPVSISVAIGGVT